MVRICALMCAYLALPAIAAEPLRWGAPVNGLRIALAYLPEDGIVEVTIENTGKRGFLLPLGSLGSEYVRLIVSTPGRSEAAVFTGASGVVPGKSFRAVVPLEPGARYVVRRPSYDYRIASTNESLGQFMRRHPSLHAELANYTGQLNIECYPLSNIWTGALISNTVQVK
jgi:hypothetical protein